jgi:hypothetical protein
LEGLTLGIKEFERALFAAATGIIRDPIHGALVQGPVGLIKGIGTGVIGVAARPSAGMLNFISRTTQGLANSFSLKPVIERVRPPRLFLGEPKHLVPYDVTLAKGQQLLQVISELPLYVCKNGHLLILKWPLQPNELFISQFTLAPETSRLLLISTHRFAVVKSYFHHSKQTYDLKWQTFLQG